MRGSQVVTVDGTSYEINQFSATKALRLLTRLASYFSEPLGVIVDKGGLSAEISSELITRMAHTLFEKLDEVEVDRTVKELLEGVRCEGKPIFFDTHFQGRLLHLFKVLIAVLEVQYGDFFEEIARLKGSMSAVVSKSNVQST